MSPSNLLSPSSFPSPSLSTATSASYVEDSRANALDEVLDEMKRPLDDLPAIARSFEAVYHSLAKNSASQFLPTPIRGLPDGQEKGRVLAMDLGGTNLRLGVVELFGEEGKKERLKIRPRVSWNIPENLKSGAAEVLFAWVAERIIEVLEQWLGGIEDAERESVKKEGVELGVTFSFPMEQSSHTSALLMPMGKGFTFSSTNDLSTLLQTAYDTTRNSQSSPLPALKIVAITNDSISTLLSAAYVHNSSSSQSSKSRAAAGIIVGTGTNATVLCPAWKLSESKKSFLKDTDDDTSTLLLNTEWSINGTASPLKPYITRWDRILDEENEKPGFQPLEEMVGGRYLGEIVRLIAVELFSKAESFEVLPESLRVPYGLDTKICSDLEAVSSDTDVFEVIQKGLGDAENWKWTYPRARIFKLITLSVSTRAAALVAAATIGALGINDELGLAPIIYSSPNPISVKSEDDPEHPYSHRERDETIFVSYTGTILEKYPNFYTRTQQYMDQIVERWSVDSRGRYGGLLGLKGKPKVKFVEAKDGGLVGAAVLAMMIKVGKT
ncbi:hypothetical protein RUND412_006261 [Rhizina undulata]